MTCRNCPRCGTERSWVSAFPHHCSCGRKIHSADEWSIVVDCEPPQPSLPGVGRQLRDFFAWLGFTDDGKCGCSRLERRMNKLGPAGCRRKFWRLQGALAAKAAKHRVPFSRLAAAVALLRAIRQAEREIRSAKTPAVE